MGKLYDENSIESLSPLAFTRLRPGVYAGDTTYSTQLLVEIISNAVDEFRSGHGNKIKVDIIGDKITVQDYGQGFIANSYRDDGKTILEAAFSVLNTSGKYREDGAYEGTSLGSFGIGSKITNFLSHNLTVQTVRDGIEETVYFEEGVFKDRTVRDKLNKELSGTIVSWTPSEEFFEHTEVEIEKVRALFKTIACLCPGLTIELLYNNNKEIFYSERGLNDYVDNEVKEKEILKNRFSFNYENGKEKMDFILTYTSNYSSTIVPYINTGLTEKGPHITQIKTVLTREINKFFREKKWLKEKDDNLSGEDIQEGMYVVFNITAPNVAYDAQVKTTVTKIDMKNFCQALADNLQIWFSGNEKEIKIIADKAISAKKAREAAKKAREAARNTQTKMKGLKAKMALSDKFVDCKSKDPSKRNLLLVEGLSAGGSVLESRNVETDCIYMLRGKVLSVLKCDTKKVLENQELSDIIRVIGAGFGNDNFDINKMNFDKIVITADQDSDGMAIELLLITFFYTYMKPLVEQGKLYRAVTPLYILKTKKEKFYLYTEEELDNWKKNHSEKYELSHAKGLGELSSEVLKEVCFEKQRYKRITVSDAEATKRLLDILEGPIVASRKQFIYDNATQLGFNFI